MVPASPEAKARGHPAGGGIILIGVDDTDSAGGGCTTFTLTEIVRSALVAGFDVIGYPRLVRLNPNVPTKTRGNAALAVEFGHGHGPGRVVGRIGRTSVVSYARGSSLAPSERSELAETAWSAVCATARWDGPHTEPALCWSERGLADGLYHAAVSRWTNVDDARRALAAAGGESRWARSPQGLVGAASALAWPARRRTYELIAYRMPARVGTPRSVDGTSVRAVQWAYPELFLCHDPSTRRTMVAPHSGCPVLFGLRATRAHRLPKAAAQVSSEPVDRWLIFETNQGTGDHLVDRSLASLQPYDAARITVTVRALPERQRGGHVALVVGDSGPTQRAALCFEPSKTLPSVAASLRPGDRVGVWAGVGADLTLRVEGLELLELVPRLGPAGAPWCPSCRRRAHSMGAVRGFRCSGCRRRWPPETAARPRVPPRFPVGVYHPTPSARRHLAPRGPEPLVRPTP